MGLSKAGRIAVIGVASALAAWIGWSLIFVGQSGVIGDSKFLQTEAPESLAALGEIAERRSSSGFVDPNGLIHIHYDPRTNLVTMAITDAPRDLVLSRLAAVTGIEIEISSELNLSERITVARMSATPRKSLDLLLEGLHATRFFHKDWVLGNGAIVARVLVIGREGAADLPAAGRIAAGEGKRGSSESGLRSSRQEDYGPVGVDDLNRALEEGDHQRARTIAEEIAQTGTDSDRQRALEAVLDALGSGTADVEPLIEIVEELASSAEKAGNASAEVSRLETALIDALYGGDRDAFFALIDPVKEFGSGGASEQLMRLVDDHRVSSRIRAMAAEGLGLLEDLRAVDALGATFDGRAPTVDDAVDDAAANSLASLGHEDSSDVLFDAFNGGDEERRQRAAHAIAIYGSDADKQMLLSLIEQKDAAGEFPVDIIQELERGN